VLSRVILPDSAMTSRAPDWSLIDGIVREVRAAPGAGLHRESLAERFRLPPYGDCMREALLVAWGQKRIDFCGQYVVVPAVSAG